MAAFDYVALDASGRRRRGVVSADTARAARRELRRQNLTPLNVEATTGARAGGDGAGRTRAPRLRSGDTMLLTRQLAMLIRSGAPVEEALNAVAGQADKRAVRSVMLSVRSDVSEGRRLSQALGRQSRSFTRLYRSMVAAGEASGDVGPVLERLADLLEQSQALKRKVLAAIVYPAVLAVVASAVVAALMVFVVPRVVEQFDTIGQDLPLLTEIVIGASNLMKAYGLPALIGVVVGSALFARAMRNPTLRRPVDRLVLRLPIAGKLTRSVAAARFARTFSSLVASGAPVLDSLEAARNTVGNLVFQDALDDIATSVREGGSLSGAMRASGRFPALLTYMAAGGERSGELAAMFEKGADYLENEFETATTIALNLLEPGIIVLMGGLVACIVLAIMLPILQLNSLALL